LRERCREIGRVQWKAATSSPGTHTRTRQAGLPSPMEQVRLSRPRERINRSRSSCSPSNPDPGRSPGKRRQSPVRIPMQLRRTGALQSPGSSRHLRRNPRPAFRSCVGAGIRSIPGCLSRGMLLRSRQRCRFLSREPSPESFPPGWKSIALRSTSAGCTACPCSGSPSRRIGTAGAVLPRHCL
jgi:hypothetical protein